MSLAVAFGSQTGSAGRGLRPRVLMVADPALDLRGIAAELERRGHEVALTWALPRWRAASAVDAVILASNPGSEPEFYDQCRRLGEAPGPMILVLQPYEDSRVAARILEAGADDCVAPPYNPHEIAARVRALLRRRTRTARRHRGQGAVFGRCRLDALTQTIRNDDGRAVAITAVQQRLLTALLARPGEVVMRQDLLDEVFGEDADRFDRVIDTHVSRLRKRLAQVTDPEIITSCRGVGYRLQVEPADAEARFQAKESTIE